MLATIGLVLGFGSSGAIASAYGIAISTTMVITTILAFPVAWKLWNWPLPVAAAVTAGFAAVDLTFFSANIMKIAHGGWLPLAGAAAIYLILVTWKRGRSVIGERIRGQLMPLDVFIRNVREHPPHRVEGTAVYMTSTHGSTPLALVHNLAHNKSMHKRVVLLTIVTEEVSRIPASDCIEHRELGDGFHQVTARHGFMQSPDVPSILDECADKGLAFDMLQTTFFLGRETLLVTKQRGMRKWRKHVFTTLARNAQPATTYFNIPPNRVIEVGTQIQL